MEKAATVPVCLLPCACAQSIEVGISCLSRTGRDPRRTHDEDLRTARLFLQIWPNDLQHVAVLSHRTRKHAPLTFEPEESGNDRRRCRGTTQRAPLATRARNNALGTKPMPCSPRYKPKEAEGSPGG